MSKDEIKENNIKAEDPFKVQIGGNHYAHFKIQPGEFISKNDLKWYEGNIIKYVTRSRFKGQLLEDLKKARHYLDMAIAEEEKKPKAQVSGQWVPILAGVVGIQPGFQQQIGSTYGYIQR